MVKNINRAEYESFSEKIVKHLSWYENRFLYLDKDKRRLNMLYNLLLDNGDMLKLAFAPNSIAHLLGIDIVCLRAKGLYEMDSYDILKSICYNSYRLSKEVSSGRLKYNDFVSDFIDDKVESFDKICGVDLMNIAFVCKYNKGKSYITGNEQLDADYYIAYKGYKKLYVVGFKQDGDLHFPITNRTVYLDSEESTKFLDRLLNNQIITMPNYVFPYYYSTQSKGKVFYLLYDNKTEKIKLLKLYSEKYNATIDIASGYLNVVNKLVQIMNLNESLMPIYEKIFFYICNRIKVDVTKLQKEFGGIPESIISLIVMYNDSLSKSIAGTSDEETVKIGENNNLSNDAQDHISELNKLKQEIFAQQKLIADLRRQNAVFQERESALKRILKLDVNDIGSTN